MKGLPQLNTTVNKLCCDGFDVNFVPTNRTKEQRTGEQLCGRCTTAREFQEYQTDYEKVIIMQCFVLQKWNVCFFASVHSLLVPGYLTLLQRRLSVVFFFFFFFIAFTFSGRASVDVRLSWSSLRMRCFAHVWKTQFLKNTSEKHKNASYGEQIRVLLLLSQQP